MEYEIERMKNHRENVVPFPDGRVAKTEVTRGDQKQINFK